MNNFKALPLSLGIAIALLLSAPVSAQTALTSTTLAAAVTDGQINTISLTSASALSGFNRVSNPMKIFVDRESMNVQAVNGTIITVLRGMDGTAGVSHANAATVYLGPPSYFATNDYYGSCTRANETVLPRLNILTGRIRDCFGSLWVYNDNYPVYTYTVAPGAQPSGSTPTAGQALVETAQTGGAQSATTGNGAAGGAVTSTAGAGGAGGTSSGTGGAGGAVNLIGGAGAGTITGGAGGAATLGAGAGANGTSAGGSGGLVNIYSGAAGTGGTGTSGAITIRQAGAAGTAALTVSTAGKLTLASTVSGQNIEITPNGAGVVAITNNSVLLTLPSGAAGGIPLLNFCGATSGATTCANTASGATAHVVGGVATLASNTAALTGFSPAFTSSSTWSCVANDITTRANPVQMIPGSGSAATITNTTGASDVVNYICIGF